MGSIVFVAWLAVTSVTALFPTPLHLVRRIDDPISGETYTVEEFCSGNRVISVNGRRVVIVDYGEQRVTEIDHQKLTYSITRFDEIAKALPPPPATRSPGTWTVSAMGNSYELSGGDRTLRIAVDRTVSLRREAIEVLIGAAYPNRRSEEQEQILRVAGPSGGRIAVQSSDDELYGLPVDESVTFENGLTLRNVVARFDRDPPPPQILLIDPGATREESHLTRVTRELQQLDGIPRH